MGPAITVSTINFTAFYIIRKRHVQVKAHTWDDHIGPLVMHVTVMSVYGDT